MNTTAKSLGFNCPTCGYHKPLTPERAAKFDGKTVNCPKCSVSMTFKMEQPIVEPPPLAPPTPPKDLLWFTPKVRWGIAAVILLMMVTAFVFQNTNFEAFSPPIEFESRGYRIGEMYVPSPEMRENDRNGFYVPYFNLDFIVLDDYCRLMSFCVSTIDSKIEGIEFTILSKMDMTWQDAFIEKYGEPHRKQANCWEWRTTDGLFTVKTRDDEDEEERSWYAEIETDKLSEAVSKWNDAYLAKEKAEIKSKL